MSEPPTEELTRIPAGFVMHNGRLVPREEMAVTPEGRPDRRRWWLVGGGALVAVVLLVAVVGALTRPGEVLPAKQQAFIDAVVHGQERVRAGNEVTVVAARLERQHRICHVLPRHGGVRGWVGTIKDIHTPLLGDSGLVTVALGHDIELRTSNSLLAAAGQHSALRPGSPVFSAVANLHDGDKVTFAGHFVPDGRSCINETSLRERNGMLTPGFVFRFTSIAPR